MNYEKKAASLAPHQVSEVLKENEALHERIASIEAQLDWFKRQLFGRKSEKQIEPNPYQVDLFAKEKQQAEAEKPTVEKVTVTYQRKKRPLDGSPDDSGLRFGPDVPVKDIELPCPELEAHPDDYEVIGTKTHYRLAQQPAAYVVLKYTRKVLKEKATQTITTPDAPVHVLEKSLADVSFLAGMLVDKFEFHLPLYRQHQRLARAGILISRTTLLNLVSRSIALLKPIYDEIQKSVLLSRVLAMDETPIRAGRKHKGKMKQGYYWPVYGDQNELFFYFAPTRAGRVVSHLLEGFSGTLITDGYAAYEKYANKTDGVDRAQCWAHTRRAFEKAEKMEPESVKEALAMIGALYQVEQQIREQGLKGEQKRALRENKSQAVVDAFFEWIQTQRQRQDLVNSNPLSKALVYAQKKERALRVFLEDPDVPIDTNHLERALRPIPMGKKAWLFCWTEVGAEQVGIIQSLICTCKLQDINPYTYLVDVLQRVGRHPASKAHELTPANWKKRFGDNPLKSDLAK